MQGSICEAHRPKGLAEVFGQGAAVFALETWLEAPHSCGFVFSGPTGVGKTSAAWALARELGVSPEDGAFGGFFAVASGEQTADSVREVIRMARTRPMAGSGWRLILIDEADRMSKAVRYLWLSAIEDLPPQTVVVFTTNAPDEFEDRFLDRCEHLEFASRAESLIQDAAALMREVWRRETGSEEGFPGVGCCPRIADEDGNLSFRRAVMALAAPLRARKMAPRPTPRPVPAEVARGRRDLSGNPLPPIGAAREDEPEGFRLAPPASAPSLFSSSTRFDTVGTPKAAPLPTSGGKGATLAPMPISAREAIRARHSAYRKP